MCRLARMAALLLIAAPSWALERDEVIELSRRGVPVAVVLEQLRATGVPAPPTPDDLVALQSAGVDSSIVCAMIRLGAAASVAAPADRGMIRLTNEDMDRICVLRRSADAFLLYAGSSQVNPVLRRQETRTFVVAPGRYRIAWMGEESGASLDTAAGQSVHVVLRRTGRDGVAVLYADVYEGARFVDSRRLRAFPLHGPPPGEAGATAAPRAAGSGTDAAPAAAEPAGRVEYASERVTGYAEK